jgi:hypothetical protein
MTSLCKTATTIILLSASIFAARSETVVDADALIPTASEHPWTMVAVAPDGSWGVGIRHHMYLAIADAVESCKKKQRKSIGCGAQLQAVQAGWIVLIRCGHTNILAPGKTLDDAVKNATNREKAWRSTSSQTGSCALVITVDPEGAVLESIPGAPWSSPSISQITPESDPGYLND